MYQIDYSNVSKCRKNFPYALENCLDVCNNVIEWSYSLSLVGSVPNLQIIRLQFQSFYFPIRSWKELPGIGIQRMWKVNKKANQENLKMRNSVICEENIIFCFIFPRYKIQVLHSWFVNKNIKPRDASS